MFLDSAWAFYRIFIDFYNLSLLLPKISRERTLHALREIDCPTKASQKLPLTDLNRSKTSFASGL